MTAKPRILIVTASMGSGHTQAALAIKLALRKQYGYHATVVDFLSGGGRYLGKVIKSTYLRALTLFPEVWDYVYRYSNEPRYGEPIKSVIQLASERFMARIIRRYSPQVLVFTHPFPCGAAAGLKEEGKIAVPLIGVVTDYAVHRLWEYPEVDYYCVATDELAAELLGQGFPASSVFSAGIPVRDMLPVSPDNNPPAGSVLVMGGGMGMGPTAQIVNKLKAMPEITSIKVVCGQNANLYRLLRSPASRSSKVRVYGFTHKIPELMAQTSLLITKPGGLTASEALAAGLPMLLVDVIGGQEEDNAVFLVEKGAARMAQDMDELEKHVREVMTLPGVLQDMRQHCLQIGKPGAAASVATVIHNALR